MIDLDRIDLDDDDPAGMCAAYIRARQRVQDLSDGLEAMLRKDRARLLGVRLDSDLARFALQHLEAIQSTMVPAWTAAVSAMEPRAALEIAGHVIGGLTKIRSLSPQRRVLFATLQSSAKYWKFAQTGFQVARGRVTP